MPKQVREHVVFASLIPAARLIDELGLSLKDLKKLSELASFRELRRHLKLREVSERMAVSTAKVGQLSRQLKDRFAKDEEEQSLTRRILSVLWVTPLSQAGITAAVNDIPRETVLAEIEALESQGLLNSIPGSTVRYKLADTRYRLVSEPWTAIIDGLTNLMSNVANTIIGRFSRKDGRAFARTLGFHVREHDFARLQQFYEEQLFPLVEELELAAQDHPEDAVATQLSILWAPELGAQSDEDEDEDEGEDLAEEDEGW